ncbi:hypothetical protein ACFL1A_03605, partial [Patescibacteria group bacterium]
IAWNIDWEGWSVPDVTLDQIDDISANYGNIPITHFFNPMVFAEKNINSAHTKKLTSWVIARQNKYDDEVAMHIHMFYELVRQSGVTSKNSPRWGFNSNDGYDVISTNYSKEDFKTILNWSMSQFAHNGLGIPLGYRAGGWFTDIKMLEVLQEAGFEYDSSGRDSNNWNGKKINPWSLNNTTQPYYPSIDNINTSLDVNLNILEIPNNGGNSYEYNSDVLINNFKDNYSGGFSDTTKVVNYMSHAQWANIEFPRIQKTLNYIFRYSYTSDNGPVLFTTLYNIKQQWK